MSMSMNQRAAWMRDEMLIVDGQPVVYELYKKQPAGEAVVFFPGGASALLDDLLKTQTVQLPRLWRYEGNQPSLA